jgi:hypothetical protein
LRQTISAAQPAPATLIATRAPATPDLALAERLVTGQKRLREAGVPIASDELSAYTASRTTPQLTEGNPAHCSVSAAMAAALRASVSRLQAAGLGFAAL